MLKRGSVRGFDHGQVKGLVKWKGEKVLNLHDQKGLGKCRVQAPHSHEGLGANKKN